MSRLTSIAFSLFAVPALAHDGLAPASVTHRLLHAFGDATALGCAALVLLGASAWGLARRRAARSER
ncbi:MAG: hypothetical protein ACU85V_00755 [Gammaproteobacteria bacterium]